MSRLILGIALIACSQLSHAFEDAPAPAPAPLRKSCEELKSEIDARIRARGVTTFTLEIVANEQVQEGVGKVVGSCDGGTRKIIYTRG